MYDRNGSLEATFQNFSALAGCAGEGVACLREASAEALVKANTALNEQGPAGTFAVGPSADGAMIRQLAVLEYALGSFWKGVESLILSHVSEEAFIFVPPSVATDAQFDAFLAEAFPANAETSGLLAAIEARYPAVMGNPNANYSTEFDRFVLFSSSFLSDLSMLLFFNSLASQDRQSYIISFFPVPEYSKYVPKTFPNIQQNPTYQRQPTKADSKTPQNHSVKAFLGDSSFQCNVRYLTDAYAGKTYNLQYAVTPGFHATDLLPTFYDLNLDVSLLGNSIDLPLVAGFGAFAQAYQSYLVSHARSGDPNTCMFVCFFIPSSLSSCSLSGNRKKHTPK